MGVWLWVVNHFVIAGRVAKEPRGRSAGRDGMKASFWKVTMESSGRVGTLRRLDTAVL